MADILLIDDEVKRRIDLIHTNAETFRYSFSELYRMLGGHQPPPGDMKRHVADIPVGYRAVYTIENHQTGWFRHLSVSRNGGRSVPGVAPVAEIARMLGFQKTLKEMDFVQLNSEFESIPNVATLLEKIPDPEKE